MSTMTTSKYDIYISSDDAAALGDILAELERRDGPDAAATELTQKLFDAQIVGARSLPHGTVRLNSTVKYVELATNTQREVTLVHPREADAGVGRVSIVSPIARALIGHAVGRIVEVPLPNGHTMEVRIVDVKTADEEARVA